MRELFVSELTKDVLGPRNGINEKVARKNPLGEYMTGILQPAGLFETVPESSSLPLTSGESGQEDSEQEDDIYTQLSPILDPKSKPSTMGISFTASAESKVQLSVCITWAKYIQIEESEMRVYPRHPHFAICELEHDPSDSSWATQFFDAEGKKVGTKKEADVALNSVLRKDGENYQISIFLVNVIKVEENERGEKRADISDFIFQPQIRIVCSDGTKIVPTRVSNIQSPEEERAKLLYQKKPFYARGHMTSAVWKDVDPQREAPELKLDYPDVAKEIPFAWIDGAQLEDEQRKIFAVPDVRTEYVPLFSIPAPDIEWDESFGPAPELSAEKIAESWMPEKLEECLRPLHTGYNKWIEKIESDPTLSGSKIASGIVEECKLVSTRIGNAIDMLADPKNADIALAFCFANKSVALQAMWKSGREFRYRPFQLGFILMSLESVARPESQHRDICDLMWVPTGGGKTEAYLVLVAFLLAYRRRLALSSSTPSSGAGIAAITRYTLRLLTIQQFRRTLSIVTASEFLRVSKSGDTGQVGWRPESFPNKDDFIWGTSQFSAGLWIGGSVTPNHLVDTQKDIGAITILENKNSRTTKDPAQILECPCCSRIVSVPARGLSAGMHELSLVVESADGSDITSAAGEIPSLGKDVTGGTSITQASVFQHANKRFFTLTLTITRDSQKISAEHIEYLSDQILAHFGTKSLDVRLVPFRASRPGYFRRTYHVKGNKSRPDSNKTYDYDIFCPNPECKLRTNWFSGTPGGLIHGRFASDHEKTGDLDGKNIPDGNFLTDVIDAFQNGSRYKSDRIPIPAFSVDDQIYARAPSVIISTVDKFARPAFERKATSLFGGVDRYSATGGYYSSDSNQAAPQGGKALIVETPNLEPPEMILQDELHLIEGPLGSMVGFYETAIDSLCSQTKKIKILASTATIKKASEHVGSIFTRSVQIFPPNGPDVEDRFFVTDSEAHPLDDRKAGRLYLGICPPGMGALTPLVNISSRLLQTAEEHRKDKIDRIEKKIDPFWTLTTYFNAVRELAGGLALYRQDIKDRINRLSPTAPRNLSEPIELSGRTESTDLPGIMEELNDGLNSSQSNAADALYTTSMFGTGVDISRLGLMIINGQTKTTSSYIQSSGRVGRTRAGLVVTLLRASRPRDLSHYEYFLKYHRQLHRFVEAPSVYPFASGVVDRAVGPVCVMLMRHLRNTSDMMENAGLMAAARNQQRVEILPKIMKQREAMQPQTRRLPDDASTADKIETKTSAALDNWQNNAANYEDIIYNEYKDRAERHVVLGDDVHQSESSEFSVVFKNAPQSMRELESETQVET